MNKRHGVKLYVQRVFIMDDADQFLPHYLRFVKGVIDANDLPLNVSREILQSSKVVDTIKSGSTKKILALLSDMAEHKPEDYMQFWSEFGPALKEGIIEDPSNREVLAKLLRFASTRTDEPGQTVSLSDYVSRMKEGQKHIYYVTAETFAAAKNSPHLEIFRQQGIEVLLLSDRVDEWLTGYLTEFEGKTLASVAKGDLDLGTIDPKEEEKQKAADESFAALITAFKASLGDAVKEVRITHRLTQSPACVVADANDMGLQMQRIFKAAGQAMPVSKPILELNPEHSLVKRLNLNPQDEQIKSWAQLLLDQAILAEGGHLDDPALFVKRMNELLLK
jgi:molecular chaperone HtpG